MIVLISTGGTIAESSRSPRHLGAGQLLSRIDPEAGKDVEAVELFDLPSSHIGPAVMLRMAHEVARIADRNDVEGVVITHGTATMEESAFFVDLVYSGHKPVVVTGAMRTPDTVGYDGARNLTDALSVARSGCRDHGVLVVMDGQIHAARDVAKVDANANSAFQSPGLGPLGRVYGDTVDLSRRPTLERRSFNVPESGRLARVELLTVYSGMNGDLIDALLRLQPRGIVLATLGGGGVHPDMLPALVRAIEADVAIVAGSRCLAGTVVEGRRTSHLIEGYGLALMDLGVSFTKLSPLKARIELMLLLSTGGVPGRWM